MFINNSYVNSAYAYNSYGSSIKQQKEQESTTTKSNPDGSKENEASKERTTYGTVALRLMSDKEYEAFDRATEHLHTNEKKDLAQNVDDFTNLFLETKEVLNGKSMLDALNNNEDTFNHIQSEYKKYGGMESVLTNAIKTIKSVVGDNNQEVMNFINRFQTTLSVDKLNLTV